MLLRESILKLTSTLVIEKELDSTHFELEFMSTTTAEAYFLDGWKARCLPKVDNRSLPVTACLKSQ